LHAQAEVIRAAEPHDVMLTTFRTWEDVGRWYAGLIRDREQPTAEVRTKALDLVRGLTSDSAKVRALYDFVSREFRYVSLSFGIGRYQPHAAAEVLANRYGDCKDKHTLLAALLAAIGIRAHPALISS
jgi:transglutaminase-like putative cysteine protease